MHTYTYLSKLIKYALQRARTLNCGLLWVSAKAKSECEVGVCFEALGILVQHVHLCVCVCVCVCV